MKIVSVKFLLCVMAAVLCSATVCLAEIKVFEKEVEESVGRNQSQDAVEAFALQKAKRLAVEEAGTYLSSLTVVEQGRLTKDQITALAAGVVKTEIVGLPKISVKAGIVHVQVKARIQVDTEVLEKQVQAMLQDQGLMAMLEAEQQKVRELEERLANLKSSEVRRLEELNNQALALEMKRDEQRFFREEQRLKAQGDIAKADLEILRQERERMTRFEKLQKEQEAARQKELEAIAKERDRLRKAQLENEGYWKELARKAELSRAEWGVIDDTLSLKQAVEEATKLKMEIANLNQRLDFQFDAAKTNLQEAYKQQIAATKPLLPPDPAPKDPFETSAEYQQRLDEHKRKVQQAEREHEQRIRNIKMEENVSVAQLKVNALEQRIQVLEPFVNRLQDLQAQRFVLPEETVQVILGEPEADNFRFPLYLEYKGKKWTKYWNYTDRGHAKAFWITRSHLMAEALFQIKSADNNAVAFCFTGAKVSHPGIGEQREFELAPPQTFEEISQWNRVKTKELSEAKREEEIAVSAKQGRFREYLIGMEFVWIESGCFMMGSNDGDGDEKPVHEVCVDGFWMGKFEVTQGQWKKVMGNNPSNFKKGDDYPVEEVSWYDAQEFIRKLNSKGNGKFRLPTEAEWEYACRSGGKNEKYSGGNDIGRVAWYESNSGGSTHRVGTKDPNGLGIYDMLGNVWEWVKDVYDSNAYSKHSRNNPIYTGGGSLRVLRGGSWYNVPRSARCASRGGGIYPIYRDYLFGFRLLRTD